MRTFYKLFLTAFFGVLTAGVSFAQTPSGAAAERVVTFKFVPGDDMFYIPWEGNNVQLDALYVLVDQYKVEITSGRVPVYVDGYSSSMKSAARNRELAFIRANRVKSELITHKGLIEDNFITKNYATAYIASDGIVNKDMVVVTLRIPAKEEPKQEIIQQPRREDPPVRKEPRREEPVVEKKEEAVVAPAADPWKHPYCFAVRTNLLYDAFLMPTIGVEWRINRNIGIKLDGSFSHWGDEKGKVQKVWALSPEVRWYLTRSKNFYVGLGGNYAEYNLYKYMLGGLFSDNTGYQGSLWSAGAVVGYQLPLSRSFAIDFNLGLGYMRSEYDSFNMSGDTRVSKAKDQTKTFWGPTQAGLSLVWTIGGNK